jgi:hypothetical protein
MVPAISFAYENPELDIMERVPRMAKLDRLVNSKLICFAYPQIGVVQASAGCFTYFYVMNDFGFRPGSLPGISNQKAPLPDPSNYYDPAKCTKTQTKDANGKVTGWSLCGNTNVGLGYKDKKTILLGWDRDMHSRVDVRLYYSYRDTAKANKAPSLSEKPISGVANRPVGDDGVSVEPWDVVVIRLPSASGVRFGSSEWLIGKTWCLVGFCSVSVRVVKSDINSGVHVSIPTE